jgi:hypothetical protein
MNPSRKKYGSNYKIDSWLKQEHTKDHETFNFNKNIFKKLLRFTNLDEPTLDSLYEIFQQCFFETLLHKKNFNVSGLGIIKPSFAFKTDDDGLHLDIGHILESTYDNLHKIIGVIKCHDPSVTDDLLDEIPWKLGE